ncbi:striated muscle preferentially expressed protein kinase isoform X1 [Fundulus heteroclitus]|uniref:striated muscle preferentially expressed protein kinase isoform X1 n=1 Tax=Fundulus heteroclitus TaxID=8078 RepID=UPI00165A192C|nr:striated muscle preferentially expressed protein kinase isoform X1 [Fundulus heteroclitus]
MRKADVPMTLKKGADETAAPPSPIIPPKRSKTSPEQKAPNPSPPVFLRKMRNAAVGTGCDIRLKVTVAGDPQPSLYWYHNDELLNMENQEYGGLWIRDCKPSDAGLYTCIANNHLGEARTSAVLAVLDLGEDSETTEDEGGDQYESREDRGDVEDQAFHGVMDKCGEEKGGPHGHKDLSTRSQPEDFARESPPQVLPPPSPRLVKRSPSSPMPSRSGSTTPVSLRKKIVVPTEYQDTVPGEFEEKTKQPKSVSQGGGQDSRPQTPLSESSRKEFTLRPSPKLSRASSKVFEKVRGLEERRRSLDIPEGSVSGRSWAGFNRAGSVDSDDGGSRLGISRESSREDLREALKEDAAERRSMFKQRAASLEEKPRYSQKVQDIENKFTEELQRIKKLVGKPHLKKSFSTEQLTLKSKQRQPLRKIEPIPPQVLQKLQERERLQWEKEQREKEPCQQQMQQQQQELHQPQKKTTTGSTAGRVRDVLGPPESVQLSDLPGQRFVRELHRVSPVTEIAPRSSSPALHQQQRAESPNVTMTLRKVERRPQSPLVQRVSRMQESPHIQEPETGRKTPVEVALRKIENRPESPLVQKRAFVVQDLPLQPHPKSPRVTSSTPTEDVTEVSKSASKLKVPTIIVEDERMEEDVPPKIKESKQTSGKEGKPLKTKGKNRRPRPLSPELDSSDDSYVSAGEDPMEAPMFEFTLQDTTASAGADVLLKTIIAGTPCPEVTWTKDNADVTGMPNYLVKVEGERHSLLIKSAKTTDSGKYCVTAVNQMGRATSSATLTVKADSVQEPKGSLGVPMEISSPITSDEEYLSPLEEVMDFGVQEPRRTIDTRFREPPAFLETITDQAVIEGQEVTMSVRITGQPKPMLYWLRDRVTVKTDPRHVVRETSDGTFEMTIKSAVRSDSGVYTCRIINEYGTKQCEARLDVKAPPVEPGLSVTRPVRDITAKAGETVLFECHVIGPKDTDVDWLADGKLIQPALLNCKMHFDGRKCRLLLNSVHEDDSGTYTCKLSTAKEEVTTSGKLKVIPSLEPLFTRKLDVLEVIEGRNARFDCKVSGTPPPKVLWSHFDQPLIESEDIRIVQEGGRHSLIISHVTSEDEGFYTVRARNGHGEAEDSAELYIQEPRPAISSQMAKLEKMPSIPEEPEVPENEVERFTMPDFIKPLYDLDVIEGKEAVLKCKVAGLPYPTIAWFHNGKRIESTEDRKMTQFRDVHSLVIRSVCHAHGGVYKSVISNKVGKATCYAHLYVTDILPDPPDGTPVIESITGRTITLSWKKPRRLDPSIDPGSLMYAIQQQALGSIQWIIIASGLKETTYTISTLSKGVRYAFRVLTITSKAFSKPSPATDPVQLLDRGPYLQEAPVIIDKPDVVYAIENQSVTISISLNHVNTAVTWKRKGVPLANKPGLYEMGMPDDDQHTLKLLKVKSSDVGEMTFVATNEFGSDSCSFSVETAAPPTFETIMEDLDICSGETPRFAVVVEGKPVPDILWFKGDVLLSESSHYTFVYDDNECSLVVLNAHPEDSGVYTCTARNLAGSVSCKAELTVHEAKRKEEPMDDEESLLRKMRRLTDYYDIHKEIGRGAFSYVKRVKQKATKTEYAAKFISTRAKKKASALREMRLLSKLDHERVLYFHDAFEKKNAVIIITELCHEELLDRFTRKSTVLESDVRSCVRQLLEGVDYLHHLNIIHLDIKPDNILMADLQSDQIRLCDFGNAVEVTPDEAQYCKYGTPEFVAPEIVNQTPVSKSTDIWPIGVVTYLCLTGISPFAGESDRSSVLNIRNYNVAFEENMFAELCREARGFIIKLLVADRLRPDTQECLRHPWFKILSKGKPISTDGLKKFASRRKWQRSIINYKSKMVMRSIPELLNDSSSHTSIAVPRHKKEGSPLPSSSSDSDEDIDELPFIPMPLNMDFSGSRMSLNDIQTNEQGTGKGNEKSQWSGPPTHGQEAMECDSQEQETPRGEPGGKGRLRKRSSEDNDKGFSEESPSEPIQKSELSRKPLRRGSSMESERVEGGRKRGELRRGGSADSALLLRITPEEGAEEENPEEGRRVLKKAVSMELPRRSASPGTAKMSQEDYALKLELMRQRLLRGGSADNKMSGLRGPLLETLGMGDEKRAMPSDRYSRTARVGPPPLTRAASSDFARDEVPKPKVLRKSTSFSQGDSEPIALHRRSGAPLEIPVAQVEERRLKEAISMSSLTEQTRLDSRPETPRESSPKPRTPDPVVQENQSKTESQDSLMEKEIRTDETVNEKMDGLTADSNFDERSSTSGFSEKDMSISEEPLTETDNVGQRMPTPPDMAHSSGAEEKMQEEKEREKKVQEEKEEFAKEEDERVEFAVESKAKENGEVKTSTPTKSSEMIISTSSVMVKPTQEPYQPPGAVASTYITPSLPARVVLPDGRMSAYASIMQTILVPSLQPANEEALAPSTPADVQVTSSASVTAQTSFPESTSSGSAKSIIMSTTEHPAVYSRVASPEMITKEPSPPKTFTQTSPQQELSAGADLEDMTSEEVFEARFKKRESSLSRSLKFLSRSKDEDRSVTIQAPEDTSEEIYRPGPVGAPLQLASRRLEEKSKSVQDLREAQKDQGFMKRLSMRLKRTPSTERTDEVVKEDDSVGSRRRLSWTLGRRGSQEKKEVEMTRMDGEGDRPAEEKELKKPNESPVLAMRRKIESTVAGISTRIRSYSEERRASEDKETKRTPILSMLRRSTSESRAMKPITVPQNQLASQASNGASSESLDSMSSLKSETSKGIEVERRSRWDRWGLTRGKRDKTVSQPDIPTAISRDNSSLRSRQYSKLASDFPPVFHIKLRDHVLLEGDPVTLSCLPAGSPHPHITWLKDKKPLEIDARMNMISCPDGRQLLMIMQTTKKDAGVYECVATNPLASVSSSCTISLARLPNRPGTPEVPQKYNNTALVVWRPSDTVAPCTYSLERRAEGERNWLIVATGVADCYYNVTELPAGGSFRFRVACVNKAGQGPYSNLSEVVTLDLAEPAKSSASAVVRTVPATSPPPAVVMMSSMKVPPIKAAPSKSTTVNSVPAPVSSVAKSPSPVTVKPVVQVSAGHPAGTVAISSASVEPAPVQTTAAPVTAPKAKTSISISVSKPQTKLAPPPVVPPKPQSPVLTFPSMTNKPPSPVSTSAPPIGKPISSVPMYVPAATARSTPPSQVAPAPAAPAAPAPSVTTVTISPPVVIVQSLTPVLQGGDSRSTPSGRITPSGRLTPSGRRTPLGKPGEGSLRQGVPQKPYTFMDEKARGRFGVIRECRENATGNLFMAKIVPYEADTKQAVLQEYDILKSLHHDRIMALHEAYVTPRYLVLISEYCSGRELLYSLIERFRYSEDDVVTYIVQILQGLDYLHARRILHLDIKPENVIVTHMNLVKIIDFGSAQSYNPLFLKQFSPPIGTLEYMSPEMLKGDVVGPPADIWSVGVLTFITLSGRSPFMENDPQETEARILATKFDLSKLYQNVSQSASLFLKKILCSYPWARPSIKDCFSNSWLQDAYLMRLRRQTLTFTTTRLKEFLADQQRRRQEAATKHKVLLRSYQSSPQTPTSPTTPIVPVPASTPVTQ